MLDNLELRQWTLGTQCTNERANRGSPKCPGDYDYVLHSPPLSPSSVSLVKLANYGSAHLCFPYTLKFFLCEDVSLARMPLHCMHA